MSTPTFAQDPQAAIAFYHEHGYHIEPQVWSKEEIAAIRAASETWPTFKDGTYKPAMMPHRHDPLILKALAKPLIIRFFEAAFGGKVSGLQSEYFYCRPGTRGFALHQDNHYVEAKPDAFASAWSPMVDVSRANGTLVIYPGTHREPILPLRDLEAPPDAGNDINAHKQECIVPPQYKPMDVVIKAGDVAFIHGHIVHSSHQNTSNDFRCVLLNTYLRAGEKFRPGNTAKRAEVDVGSRGPAVAT